MKIKNYTQWPDFFLRRMTVWCCRELELPVNYLRIARFANTQNAWGGLAHLQERQIGVRVGNEQHFPTKMNWRGHKEKREPIADRMEALVMVTAHELAHIEQWRRKTKTRAGRIGGGSESITDHLAISVLNAFRSDREKILAAWNEAPIEIDAQPVAEIIEEMKCPGLIERRAEKVAADLARWQKKFKLAQTKVRKLRAKARYYSRKMTAASPGK